MSEIVNVAIAVSAKSGPELKATWQLSPPAYEKTRLEVEPTNKPKIKLAAAKQIQWLAIGVGAGDGSVKYTLKAGGKVDELKELPQVVIYRAVMLPPDDELELEFENTGTKPVTIDVLAGRALG